MKRLRDSMYLNLLLTISNEETFSSNSEEMFLSYRMDINVIRFKSHTDVLPVTQKVLNECC